MKQVGIFRSGDETDIHLWSIGSQSSAEICTADNSAWRIGGSRVDLLAFSVSKNHGEAFCHPLAQPLVLIYAQLAEHTVHTYRNRIQCPICPEEPSAIRSQYSHTVTFEHNVKAIPDIVGTDRITRPVTAYMGYIKRFVAFGGRSIRNLRKVIILIYVPVSANQMI